jgi:hypothetical protein
MTRKTLALAALVLIALVGGTGRAQAAGGTYRITVGGDGIVGWAPDSGATDQTSDDKLSAVGTLASVPPNGAVGTADYEIASGPGVVRAQIDGSFTIPSNLAYPFAPSMQAVSTTELTISGPEDFFVNTSVNLHVDGVIRAPVCGGRDECGAESVYVSVGPFVRQSEFNTFGDTRDNTLGLILDPVPGGYHVHGDVTSATLGVRTNTPYPVTIVLNLSGRYSGTPTPTTIGGNMAVSFAPTGPVLNDIPAGYTVSAPNVTDNRWSDPFAGPADTTPPTVTGTPVRQPNVFGWYQAPVTIDWAANDDSGQASDPADTVADQDGKDVVYTSGQSCDPSGNCATGAQTISLDQVPPTVTCREAPVFEVEQHSIAFVIADVSDALSGSGGEANAGVDISSAGDETVQITGDDFADNIATATCPYRVVDTQLPRVTGVPDRSPNFFGWYREPVTIDWQVIDESGQAGDPADTLADRDGKDVVYTSHPSCDPSGNCATGTFTISLDRVPPAVTCRPAPVFDLTHNSIAFVSADVSDALSGSSGEANASVDISTVGNHTVQIDGHDFAGNSTIVTCPYVVVDSSADTTPPVVTGPGDTALDAAGPGGARLTFTASASDDRDPPPHLGCSPASGSTFPIGTTTVTCTATDAAGNSASAQFTVHVRSAGEQITRLIDKTNTYVDVAALRPALRAPLQLTAVAVARNRQRAACLALGVYIAAVRLAPGGALTPAERAELIADANRIRAVLGC